MYQQDANDIYYETQILPKEREEAQRKWKYVKWKTCIKIETCFAYWVFIPTITWHKDIKEVEIMFLCFNLIFAYRKLISKTPIN